MDPRMGCRVVTGSPQPQSARRYPSVNSLPSQQNVGGAVLIQGGTGATAGGDIILAGGAASAGGTGGALNFTSKYSQPCSRGSRVLTSRYSNLSPATTTRPSWGCRLNNVALIAKGVIRNCHVGTDTCKCVY